MTIGQRIKELRNAKGLTQKKLAEKSELAEITIRQYETNKRTPQTKQLEKISIALNVPITDLLGIELDNFKSSLNKKTILFNFLDSLGFQYIDTFYDNDFGYDRCIHIINENKDIPLTKEEFEKFVRDINDDIETRLYKLRKDKNI